MKKYFVVMTLLSFQFSAICQSFEAADSTIRFEDLMNELYEDSVFSARIAHYAEELEKHPTYNDSFLIGKFPLVLSKAGADWFSKFAALKDRVKFYKNLNDTIKDLSAYYENEIKMMDYDSIAFIIQQPDDIFMYDKIYEGFLREIYKFLKKGKVVRVITINFWGGKQFYAWRDEPSSRMEYIIRITEDGSLDYHNVQTIQPKP
jgi:hypothetical protein